MNHKRSYTALISLALTASLLAGTMPAAFAQTTGGTASSTRAQALISRAISRADQEIQRRITALNALASRINDMRKISDTDKSGLNSTVQGQISELTALKAKIDADTDAATLKTDVQSITKSYRIYVLVIPQGALMAAADRVLAIADAMTSLAGMLQTRITEAQSAGHDVAALQTALSDLNAKVTDAGTQARAALAEVSGLTPDNGDQAKAEANHQALIDARAKIRAAAADFKTARQDAGTIVKALKSFSAAATSTASTTAPAGGN